jgi:poly(A) polymerase
MIDALARLRRENIPCLLCSYSSLDRFFRVKGPGPLYVATDSSIVSLAKVFDDIQFPGLPLEDAAVQEEGTRLVFRCMDSLARPPASPFTVLSLQYDPARDTFMDRLGVYPELRAEGLTWVPDSHPSWLALCEAAKLVSRYHYSSGPITFGWARGARGGELPPLGYQKELLAFLLTSADPAKGLTLLESAGFVAEAWPELATMSGIPHVKDYHPEGNVWEHTLATFAHRKKPDLILSLGLLLHDMGKPDAEGTGEKRFDGHSEIGARLASRFLRRIGFSEQTVRDVEYLVRFHMMPAALKALPPFRTDPILSSPLFPQLLEVYRADGASSYMDEKTYYEACRFYKSWLRNRGNPYIQEKMKKQRAARRR